MKMNKNDESGKNGQETTRITSDEHSKVTQTSSAWPPTTVIERFKREYFDEYNKSQPNVVEETLNVNSPTQHSSIITHSDENLSPLPSADIFDDLDEFSLDDLDLANMDDELNDLNIDEIMKALGEAAAPPTSLGTNALGSSHSKILINDNLTLTSSCSTMLKSHVKNHFDGSNETSAQISIPKLNRLNVNVNEISSSVDSFSSSNGSTSISIQCGLQNMGNTCYLNAVLQMLANTTLLKDSIFGNSHLEICQRQPTCSLYLIEKTLRDMHQTPKVNGVPPVYAPYLFHNELELLSSKFTKNTQQDCNELLLSLFNNAEESSILSEIFEFITQRVNHCEKCDNSKRVSIERQTIVECPVPETACELADCLNSYCKKEPLTGDNAYYCDICKSKQNGDTKMEFCSAPPIILFGFKRSKGNGREKLHSAVRYEEVFHLDKWLNESCLADITENRTIYHLFAVIIHDGNNMESGHYICYVKNESTKEWYEANDESFKKLRFLRDMTKQVYLLCYARSDLSKSIVVENTKEIGISAKLVDNQRQRITDEELLNDLENKVQFYFSEDVHHEQRRYGKCDVFGKLDSEQSKVSHRRLWVKGKYSTPKVPSYPKLKLGIPLEYHGYRWSLTVHTATEHSKITNIHYSHIEKKFLQNLNDRSAPLINPIDIEITPEDLSNQIHTLYGCVINEGNLINARRYPLQPLYNSKTKQQISSSNPNVSDIEPTANNQGIDLKNFHFLCVLKFKGFPLKYCISSQMCQYDDGKRKQTKPKVQISSTEISKKKNRLLEMSALSSKQNVSKDRLQDLVSLNDSSISLVKPTSSQSELWSNFSQLYHLNVAQDYIVCLICRVVLRWTSETGTKVMNNHNCIKKSTTDSPSTPSGRQRTISSYLPVAQQNYSAIKSRILGACVEFCAFDGRPFECVAGSGFISLSKELMNTGALIGTAISVNELLPHPTTVSRHVERVYNTVKGQLNTLCETVKNFSVTSDFWTENFTGVHYGGVSLHFIDSNNKLRIFILACKPYDLPNQKAPNVRAFVDAIVEEVGLILNNDTFVVSDNEPKMECAFRQNATRVGCSAHYINKILEHAFEKEEAQCAAAQILFKTVRDIVTNIHQSHKQAQLSIYVCNYCKTRFSGAYLMFESILKVFNELPPVLSSNQRQHYLTINHRELEELTRYLKHFHDVIEKLSCENTPTLHLVVPYRQLLLNRSKITDDDDKIIIPLKKFMSKQLNTYWIIHDVHYIATMLHPNLKSFNHTPDQKLHAEELLKEEVEKISNPTPILPAQTTISTNKEKNNRKTAHPSNSLDEIFDAPKDVDDDNVQQQPLVKTELQRYLEDETLIGNDLDVLTYWDLNKLSYPTLTAIAQRVLSVPATNTSVERIFSDSGNTVTDRRTRLETEKINNLLFIRRNLRTLREIFPPAAEEFRKRKHSGVSTESTPSASPMLTKKLKPTTSDGEDYSVADEQPM